MEVKKFAYRQTVRHHHRHHQKLHRQILTTYQLLYQPPTETIRRIKDIRTQRFILLIDLERSFVQVSIF